MTAGDYMDHHRCEKCNGHFMSMEKHVCPADNAPTYGHVLRGEEVFEQIARVSSERSKRWTATGTRDLSVLERAAEVAGEVGEVVNVAKKLLRHELGMVGNFKAGDTTEADLKAHLEMEIGDGFITLFNLANKAGVDPWRGLQDAFNSKSAQLGFPERL